MATGPYLMRLVIGSGCKEERVAVELALVKPVRRILGWHKSILIDQAVVINGGVLLDGRLRSRCFLSVPKGIAAHGTSKATRRWGVILFDETDIGFTVHIPVTGAEVGMAVTVTAAHVLADASVPSWDNRTGSMAGLCDRSLVLFAVRVVQPVFARPGRRRERGRRERGSGTWVHRSVFVPELPPT